MTEPKRECGDCRACCTIMAVEEIPKPNYQRCQHVGMFGCTIYAERPDSCQNFQCLWLQGVIDADSHVELLRPDKLKVMFDYQPDTKFGEVFKAYDVEPGATDRPAARTIIETLAADHLVVIMGPKKRQLVGPKKRVKAAERVIAEAGYTTRPMQGNDDD